MLSQGVQFVRVANVTPETSAPFSVTVWLDVPNANPGWLGVTT
jgi:hypothetical protein